MPEEKSIILVVEDDLDVADMLNAYFRVQGYEVLTANWGEDAIRACSATLPDLVILDIRLPDIDGFEVARRLRTNRRTKEIPIIFLTEKRSRQDRLQGLGLGADDYITKPFDVQELRLRVRNALRRSTQGALTNPVTNLPEGVMVEERLAECLEKDGWSLLVISLLNLENFREAYGFVASDDVLRAISLMINNAVHDAGGGNNFVGQLTNTSFIIIAHPSIFTELNERIHNRLAQSLDYFYPLKDRDRDTGKSKRLAVRISSMQSNQCSFKNIEEFKIHLLKL